VHRFAGTALLIVAMVVLIVTVDARFLRDRFWLRLTCNIGIVAAAAAIYLVFLHR
jgi:hypothetical protein